MSQDNYEYLDDCAYAGSYDDDNFENHLNSMGANGWELVTIMEIERTDRIKYRLIWKRKK